MRVFDPLLFLIGNRGAIERIAATRHAWLVGAILVLSAGIARNYDHLDLLTEFEWFIGPFAASLVSIVFIFLCIEHPLQLFAVGSKRKQLGTFLTFAWMTAPCAWLYGIPVEGMTDVMTATKWNIAFLAVVSLWRVALMTRAVSVLTGVTTLRALVLVLTPAAIEAVAGFYVKAMSLVQIMGGVRLPPDTRLLREASQQGLAIAFILAVMGVVACNLIRGRAVSPLYRPAESSSRAGFGFAMTALLIWIALSLPFHPQLSNKAKLERLIQAGEYPQAIAFAASKKREDFPRLHHLPPQPNVWFPFKLLLDLPPETPAWLREEWTSNVIESLKMQLTIPQETWQELSRRYPRIPEELSRYANGLRESASKDNGEGWWLPRFDRLNEHSKSPTGSDPTQPPSPGK
jgi:hypothetical protein